MSLGPSNKCSSRNDMPARTWREIITLAANTGQRGSDLVKMRWSDIEESRANRVSTLYR